MDSSELFSHPDRPESLPSAHWAKKPAEYPTFSDRPESHKVADNPSS
jgi:hypothetical protein